MKKLSNHSYQKFMNNVRKLVWHQIRVVHTWRIWLYFQLVANALAISYSGTHSKVITHLPLIFIKEYIIKFIFLPISLRYQQINPLYYLYFYYYYIIIYD